jgi:hypothetical protein
MRTKRVGGAVGTVLVLPPNGPETPAQWAQLRMANRDAEPIHSESAQNGVAQGAPDKVLRRRTIMTAIGNLRGGGP